MYESDLRPDHHDGQFCRLCFHKTDDLCPLFSSANIPNKALLHKIFDCTTITLSFRDDHDANICANCIVSIETFFKYKAQCVENDRLLRKKRVSFFAGLGLAAGDAPPGDGGEPESVQTHSKRRRLEIGDGCTVVVDDDDDDEEELDVDRKRDRTFVAGEDRKACNGAGSGEDDDGEDTARGDRYRVKEETIETGLEDDEEANHRQHGLVDDDDDDEEYFNPNQFLAQETQIDEGDGENETSSDGGADGLVLNSAGHDDNESSTAYERAWKTTEFAPQPGASGLRTLKITDYSNVTGKRGRPQRFETDMLAANSDNLLAYHHREAVYRELQRLNGMAAAAAAAASGGSTIGRMSMVVSPQQGCGRRSSGTLEPTKKVQKFLDDGLRELIYNAGAPNPHYSRDGGSTSFKVVKARFNSYNIIFDDNRFLRRNKSVSGLPKWYWACSMTGCPVKICSYAGRLFRTNELSHTHPPTEPDADSKYETIQPDPVEAELLQRQLLLQQQQQHQAQQQRLVRQQQQQQVLRQRQMELAQRRVIATAALMAAAAASATRNEELDRSRKSTDEQRPTGVEVSLEPAEPWRNYELVKAEDGGQMLVYAGHTHGLIMTRKDGVRIYRCTSVARGAGDDGGGNGQPCTDTVFLRADGRLAKVCKEEHVNYDMELPDERKDGGDAAATDEDDKPRRPQKIIVYEGYRYKYCHARPEGSFSWRCVLRHEKDCLASIQTKRNLEFLNVNDQPHNHDPPDPAEPQENAMLCEIRLPVEGEEAEGSTDFKLVKSGQKREFLIYKGYRYYFQYESKNGRRSYRCTMFKNCPAGAFLLPNSTIQEAKNFIHTHPPVEDMEKYITKDSLITSPLKSEQAASVEGGDPAAMAAWKAAQTGGGPSGAIEPLSKDPEVARRNGYRIIKNYKNKEIMIYLGWRYFEDYKKKSGGQVWRCSSHRLCRGSVHLFPDGSINFAKLVDHNHSPPKKILSHSTVGGSPGKAGGELDVSRDTGGDCFGRGAGVGGAYHRYITHQGHRFRFATRKREGTIYWRCALRLATKCPVSFHTREDSYELVSTRNHEHNHPIPTDWPEMAGGQIDEELPKVRLPAEEIGTTDFVLSKNSKGRDLILYRNGRFYLDYARKDGKIVFRCSAVSGCRATVLLLLNKTLHVPKDFSHNHPTVDGWGTPGGTEQGMGTARALKLDDEVDIKHDVNGTMSYDGSRTLADSTTLPKLILHNGFHYCFVSRHPSGQNAFFRCFNFDAKKNPCHASLYTDLSGVVVQTSQHPHNHEPGDYQQVPAFRHQQQDTADLIGTRDYKIVKNWKNRDVLVFQNCRYFLHYVRKDGRKVWRCSAIRSCHAAVYLNADGTVDQFRGQHVHEIRPEGEPRRRRRRRKAELMFPFGAGGTSMADANQVAAMATMFGNGMGELLARAGAPSNGTASSSSSMMNGSVALAAINAINGGTNGGGAGHTGGNEWIDYSDYGIQMSATANDTVGSTGRTQDESHSLWEHFHPHQGMPPHATERSGVGGGEGETFDFNYHSVFGNQDSFNAYAAHALAHHHLQQQHRSIQQQLQQQQRILMNGSRQHPQQVDSSDPDDCDQSVIGGGGPDHAILVPEVKIESDDL